ncbi:AraC family transcriptional regulator [Acidicapsa ligni]|uniref:AraC family transcriptional regulator n=1 Tax=Acidicapsa ligni TaxID=542300 RepID=UPI0021DF97D6|nr:AraC family transcriptional regulator [Acidicapsa ligni]
MDELDKNQKKMVALLNHLATLDGMRPSSLQGVRLLRSGCSTRLPVMYEPSIIIVAQGRKRGYLHDRHFTYDARNYLTLTVPLPFECETEVAEDGPFLGVGIRIELAVLSDLLMQLDPKDRPKLVGLDETSVSATELDPALSDATIRLLECMTSAADANVLGPQVIREIHYRVLQGKQGGALQSLLLMDGPRKHMHRILHRMHSDYASPMDVPALASEIGMSVSALHHHFKALTATSPLQYLKTVRLHKARMLMVQDSLGASIAAERVGYESPSQFSREFKRLFGFSPVDETHRLRNAFSLSQPSTQAG